MRGYGSTQEDYLFSQGDWFATHEAWKKKLTASVETLNSDELLNTSTSDLAAYYVSEYQLDVPTIYPDEIVVDQRETQIDISQDRNRLIHEPSRVCRSVEHSSEEPNDEERHTPAYLAELCVRGVLLFREHCLE